MHLATTPLAQLNRARDKKKIRAHEHTDQMDDIGILRARDPDKKIVGFDVAVYEGLVMDRLNSRNLMGGRKLRKRTGIPGVKELIALGLTICFAAMHTVLIENLRPHMSNRSSRLGPKRSIARTLCNPSWPK